MADLLVGRRHRGAFNNPLGINTPQFFTESATGLGQTELAVLFVVLTARVLPKFLAIRVSSR